MISLTAALFAFLGGVAVGRFALWPFPLLSKMYRVRGAAISDAFAREQFKALKPLTLGDLRRVATPEDVVRRRAALVNYIWPGKGFPSTRLPDVVRTGVTDEQFRISPNLLRITSLTTRMRGGVESVAYYFEPRANHDCLMLYNHGHGETFRAAKPTIDRLLEAGCSVIGLSMPLATEDEDPIISDSSFGSIPLRRHDQLALLEAPDFSPISFFVEPVAASLNYVLATKTFDRVGMLGFSGGGWTTTLYAAIDERIRRSYPVAGSEPQWLTVRRPIVWSDYEQYNVGLYRTANYPELYVLATSGNRRQLQILNRFDACCFYGRGYELYANAVSETAKKMGGEFRVFLDETHREHKLSKVAMDTVLSDFLHASDPSLAKGTANTRAEPPSVPSRQ